MHNFSILKSRGAAPNAASSHYPKGGADDTQSDCRRAEEVPHIKSKRTGLVQFGVCRSRTNRRDRDRDKFMFDFGEVL